MTDLLNPLNPLNPVQQTMQGGKGKKNKNKETFHENRSVVPLPSRGVFYYGDYKGMDVLNVRPLNFTDEDILTTESFFTNGTVFNELLSNVIIDDNNFDAKNLVPVDRDTILIWLRSTSFGNEFEIEYHCPACGGGNSDKKIKNSPKKPGILKWDLNALEIPQYSEEVFNQLIKEGCVIISTPMTKIRVKVTVPSIGRTMVVEKSYQQKKQNERSAKDFYATSTLLSVVSGVEIEPDQWVYGTKEISEFFNKVSLPLSDSRFILKTAGELNLKYDTKQDFICKDCGHIQEGVEMPILHKNFFWPES